MPLDQPLAPPAHQVATGQAVRDGWDDPDDRRTVGTRTVRQVYGYRRHDPIIAMHRQAPREVTEAHVRAVSRLRDDYEIGEGVSLGKGTGGDVGPTDAMLDAKARFRDARDAMGSAWAILGPIAMDGWSVRDWAAYHGYAAGKAAGMLIAALGRLHDHYNPVVSKKA